MSDYSHFIENTPLIERVDITTTGGDPDYNGTAIEISDESGNELFHVVVDSKGERQFLFIQSQGDYRITLDEMEQIIASAKKHVRSI